MIKFETSEYLKQRPGIQMTSMIDIMFINLLFFMALFVYFNFENELSIAVPKAKTAIEAQVAPEELVINIEKDGGIIVNQKKMDLNDLEILLKRTSALYPGQAVIIRADEKTYHQNVIYVLDVCAKSKVWNISFATAKEK